MTSRSLPQVIGPTENALRSLLRSLLAPTVIEGYEQWVALNATSGDAAEQQICSGLLCSADRARDLLRELEAQGLVERGMGTWTPTSRGVRELDTARRTIAAATARVVRNIDDDEMAVAVSVLDRVRARAHDELSNR